MLFSLKNVKFLLFLIFFFGCHKQPVGLDRKQKCHPAKKKSKQQTNKKKQANKMNRISYPLPHAFMENAISHNVAEAHIPCLQHCYGGH